MSFEEKISYANLEKWVKAYKNSKYDENETNNCMISLKQLESFMNYIHQENIELGRQKKSIIDKVRIYLVRDYALHGSPCQTPKGEQSQISFVIVPMTDYSNDYNKTSHAGGKDYIVNGNICIVTPGGEGSGLCPTNCGGSI